MISPARQYELSLIAAKAERLILIAGGGPEATMPAEDAGHVVAAILANMAQPGEGPEFSLDAPVIGWTLRALAQMQVSVMTGACEEIPLAALDQ